MQSGNRLQEGLQGFLPQAQLLSCRSSLEKSSNKISKGRLSDLAIPPSISSQDNQRETAEEAVGVFIQGMAKHNDNELSASFVVLSVVRPQIQWVGSLAPSIRPHHLVAFGVLPKPLHFFPANFREDVFLDQPCAQIRGQHNGHGPD